MTAPRTDELWPPRSARQALLSSPSGKRRYADLQAGKSTSPIKGPHESLSLLDRMRLVRRNQDQAIDCNNDGDEEDEETLRLQLAAIEAKLKLKKLQKREKKEDGLISSDAFSSRSSVLHQGTISSHVEVMVSPAKRPPEVFEQKSPSRVMLGIDKGVRGADISLHRAKTVGSSPLKSRNRTLPDGKGRGTPACSTTETSHRAKGATVMEIKSFSERMAEVRGNEREQAERRTDVAKARSRHFKLDAAEIENFKAAAGEVGPVVSLRSPIRERPNSTFDGPEPTNQSHGLRKTKTLPDLRNTADQHSGNATLFEGFSGFHLSSRILPHTFLKRTLPSDEFTTYRIPDLLKTVTSPAYELPDEVGNYVVFGVVASKSSPLDQKNQANEKIKTSKTWESKWEDGSQNRQKFMVMTLTDLKWTIDLYLFDTALPRYHRLSPGTVVAILNPSIMPPKKGREDTGAFSLALHDGDDTVLEIGTSKHLAFCNVTKRDGKQCGQWVNGSKSEICEWHLNAQVAKTQSKRMGVNAGANGFGSKGAQDRGKKHGSQLGDDGYGYGLLPTKQGRGYDRWTGSHFYITSSNSGVKRTPVYNPDISTVNMLDADDDPFIAEGQISRDKESWLKKRLAKQEKERDIARQLGNLGSGSSAGADYMRRKAHGTQAGTCTSHKPSRNDGGVHPLTSASGDKTQSTAHTTAIDVSRPLTSEIGRKRKGEDVRLSPAKKTRFLSEQGIKVAGKESTSSYSAHIRIEPDFVDDVDDDDDLDIV